MWFRVPYKYRAEAPPVGLAQPRNDSEYTQAPEPIVQIAERGCYWGVPQKLKVRIKSEWWFRFIIKPAIRICIGLKLPINKKLLKRDSFKLVKPKIDQNINNMDLPYKIP